MYYLQSRYYDPEICRFINADSFASTGQGILGYNMFTYCLNSPCNLCDPTGEFASLGEIHNEVVDRIANKYGYHSEQHITFTKEQQIEFKKLWGRADLISPSGQVWDVKRDRPRQIAAGIKQVSQYVQGKWFSSDTTRDSDITLTVGCPEIEYGYFYYKSG